MEKKSMPLKLFILALVASVIGIFFYFDLGSYITLDALKNQHRSLVSFYHSNRVFSVFVFMSAYIVMAAFSLPGATVMTLAGASVFGFVVSLVAVSFASTIGATLAFLASRFLFKDYVEKKFGDKLLAINKGMEKDGNFYLFTLRLIPVFPFFMINLLMGLTRIRALSFYLVSQIGMLPGTAVYVNAGTRLGELSSIKGILSPGILFSLALLGIFPWIAKWMISKMKSYQVMKRYKKPSSFDYNLIVIGGGSAGLVSAYIAAMVKARVCLIEKNKMGGDCLNTGCVPSKAIIKSAKLLSMIKNSLKYGIDSARADYDFKRIMERVHRVIKKIEPHDSVERYESLGVECISGEAKIISPYEVMVNGKIVTSKRIIVATGASPFIPPIKGLDSINYLTSDNLWELDYLPENLVVLGGGPIGCELSQAFARLGSNVTIVEMAEKIMIREDDDVSSLVSSFFEKEGINILTGHAAVEVEKDGDLKFLIAKKGDAEIKIAFDEIIVAVGRRAESKGFGLEELGVEFNPNNTIKVDEYLNTNIPTIYCAGDVAGPYQFTHTAAHQAWYASVNALFGSFKRFRVDYSIIPWATYTDPEVARVGMNEKEASLNGIDFKVTKYDVSDLDRAIADSSDYGFVKVITSGKSDKILGVTIACEGAGNMISEFVLAMKYKLGLNKILGTIHIYPTFSEANKYAAGEWKKSVKPEKLIEFAGKYHKWMRK